MRDNPKGDWRIEDVARVCRRYGANLIPPSGGSHYKVDHPSRDRVLSIPAAKPIKHTYIRQLVRYLAEAES